MARVLNADGALSWNRQHFETVVMLSEMKRVVANSQDIPRNPGRPIIELASPLLPKGNNSRMISVPIVNRYSVVFDRNNMASYADVIAPYRLVQARFSTDGPTAQVVLDLTEELDKMGLLITNDNYCVLQQKLTSSFYHMWETLEAVPPSAARSIPFEEKPVDDVRSECYPYNTLTMPESIEDAATILYDARLGKCLFATEDADSLYTSEADRLALVAAVKVMNETGPLMEFDGHRPITAVFATNGALFCVPKTSIERKDVDWQGRVTTSIPELSRVLERLRRHVDVRFQFY